MGLSRCTREAERQMSHEMSSLDESTKGSDLAFNLHRAVTDPSIIMWQASGVSEGQTRQNGELTEKDPAEVERKTTHQ